MLVAVRYHDGNRFERKGDFDAVVEPAGALPGPKSLGLSQVRLLRARTGRRRTGQLRQDDGVAPPAGGRVSFGENQTPVQSVSGHMDQQQSIEDIARVCHEANRAWCFVNGDVSQVEWAEAPAWQRESAIRGVEFALANPDAPDSAQHDAWSADKVRDGWQYGPVKDAQAKTHPCLVPFDQLPAHQQAKDRLFHAIVRALANRFG